MTAMYWNCQSINRLLTGAYDGYCYFAYVSNIKLRPPLVQLKNGNWRFFEVSVIKGFRDKYTHACILLSALNYWIILRSMLTHFLTIFKPEERRWNWSKTRTFGLIRFYCVFFFIKLFRCLWYHIFMWCIYTVLTRNIYECPISFFIHRRKMCSSEFDVIEKVELIILYHISSTIPLCWMLHGKESSNA